MRRQSPFPAPSGRAGGRKLIVAAVLALAALAGPAAAHNSLGGFVVHDGRIVLGSSLIDVELVLTYRELAALDERRALDRDGDGRVDQAEVAALGERFLEEMRTGLRVSLAGRDLALVSLADPRVDLLGD